MDTITARELTEGTTFIYRGRAHTATHVGKFQGTIKVTVEGYKFPLDLYPATDLQVVKTADLASA